MSNFRRQCFSALTLGGLLLLSGYLTGHDIITTNLTYSRDVSRIFAQHCLACHSARASIALTNYQEVRPWAVGIKEQVLSRSMPPWGAVKGFGDLSPDNGLTQEDIMIIAAWVIGGAPEGDPQMLPKPDVQLRSPKPLHFVDALTIDTSAQLRAPLHALAIRPIAESVVPSARLIARLPDGRIEPLLWLYRFNPKSLAAQSGGNFRFRKPLDFPAGTVIECSVPLRFAVETDVAKELPPVS